MELNPEQDATSTTATKTRPESSSEEAASDRRARRRGGKAAGAEFDGSQDAGRCVTCGEGDMYIGDEETTRSRRTAART